jgi:replication factor C small subunit
MHEQHEQAIWTEKYRPRKFSEVKGQKEIVARIQAMIGKGNIPHLMFSGPAGVGKTTLALVIARELYGDEWRSNFLELNASDERGIDVVRVKIKDFARTKGLGDVPFKLIYLDEADALTREAQQALRRTMENYTNTTRFLISCNYSSKIIDPIQSRCAVFRFKPLDEKDLLQLIDKIEDQEKLKISADAKKALIDVSGGDVRRLENLLQACASQGNKIDEEAVFQIASFAKPQELDTMLVHAVKGEFLKAKEILLKVMLDYGLSGLDVIKQIQQAVWKIKELSDREKVELVKLCGEAEFRMVEGSDEVIQLEALLAASALLKKTT